MVPPPSTKTAGFTYLELLVVMIIIGILAAIAAPSWFAFLTRQRIIAARGDLVAAISAIQTDAQQQSSYRTVWIDSNSPVPTIRVGGTTATFDGSQPEQLGSTNMPDNTVQFLAFRGSDNDGSIRDTWAAADTLTGNCDAVGKACFQFNYQGIPTNPQTELLPFDADTYVDGVRVPFKIEIVDPSNPTGTSRQCVIISTLLGKVRTESGNACDQTPTEFVGN